MKTNPSLLHESFNWNALLLALAAVLFLALTSHGAQRPSISAGPILSESLRAELGTVGLTTAATPAQVGFEKPVGKAGDAAEGAKEAATSMLTHPLGIALAPIAAIVGGISEGSKHVPADELAKSETELAAALKKTAEQLQLVDHLVRAAQDGLLYPHTIRTVGVPRAESDLDQRDVAMRPVDTVLEVEVESLRLRRTGPSETSYALMMTARVRLIRNSDKAVLYDHPYHYRSGTSLFIDWTLDNAAPVRAVAETACRSLADTILQQLFFSTSNPNFTNAHQTYARVLSSGSAKHPRFHPTQERTGPGRKTTQIQPIHHQASAKPLANRNSRGVTEMNSRPMDPTLALGLGQIGIVSTSTLPKLALQRPMIKEKALGQARHNAARIWGLDEKEFDQKLVRQFAAPHGDPLLAGYMMAMVIPSSLAGQVAGAANGVPAQQLRKADASVTRAANEFSLQDAIRSQLLSQANEATKHPITLVQKPIPTGPDRELAKLYFLTAGTLAYLPPGQSAAEYLASQGIDTLLEVRLLHPSLNGTGTINPPLSFNTELRVHLTRVREGRQLYSFAMKYRSPKHRFTEWAAHDAKALRQELDHFSQVAAATIVHQLSLRAWPIDTPIELADLLNNAVHLNKAQKPPSH